MLWFDHPQTAEVSGRTQPGDGREALTRIIVTPHTPEPEVQLLSNGRYHVMVTNAGSGYSRWNDLAITRWAEDIAQDDSGTFCYLRDLASGDVWSTAFQPTLKEASDYEARFTQARAEFWRRDFGLDVHTDISISPEDDIELRRVTITNRSRVERRIELTSYAEVVLSRPEADLAHPAFSKLFVQTEIDRDHEVLLCKRRARSPDEMTPWLFHLMAAESDHVSPPSYETDRTVFLGRGNSVARPAAMRAEGPLSNSAGSVLDPIVSVRRSVVLQPDDTVRFDVVTGIVDSRENALLMADKYHDRHLGDRVFELAWTHGQVVLQQLNIRESDARLYARLSSALLFASPARRAAASLMLRDHRNQAGLWSYGISGDLPIVLLRIGDQARIDLVRQVVRAHAYWRSKGLAVDLVIWNEDHSGYRQELQDQIMALISAGADSHSIERPGGIFLRRAEQVPEPDRILFQAVARVIITDSGGSLSDQTNRRLRVETPPAVFHATRESRVEPPARQLPSDPLRLFNGLGGFSADGREYWIRTSEAQRTPMPWVNVLANPYFGAVVSESGSCSTWRDNAHEYRLTPWYNDPTTDRSGEVVYIRDDETGDAWSATPLPAGGSASYLTRHGFGYSTFECTQHGINSELSVYVAIDAPVRFAVLKVRNESQRTRSLSAYNYVEWVLGELRSKSLLHVTTEVDAQTRALLARNRFSAEFSDRIAFLDCSESVRSITGSRTEFLGRNGSIARPAALHCMQLTGKVGAGFDPCGAVQTQIVLEPGQERHVVFLLGAARDLREAQALCQRFRGVHAARQALAAVRAFWKSTLGTLRVHTPDETLDLLSNGWLIYQVLACRVWGRCGYYQSGGAFGFRDQLQDVMALVHAAPAIARQHLLVAAEHQFREGDVQHWWHPPTGRGVRTHFSDDLLWLPLATAHYVKSTGDVGVLDESLHFLEGRPCKPEEESYYDLPARSEERASLYDHCLRSIHHGFKLGAHGLPLIGCGDWNDGLNLVGPHGRGESVWLAFFLYEVLKSFANIARQRGDTENADDLVERAGQLQQQVEVNGWDGRWYRRAYFDDGSPLGSAQNAECQIDSLPQSWAVLSGAGDRIRADMALHEVEARLVDRPNSLIRLFTPPFDVSGLEPGYIKGYVPGVRENGGQYTHAAIWVAMALAKLGSHRAWEYFELINPLRHGATRQAIATYKVEPYVVAADVYAVPPHVGRGGWTWYTGSAGWMYRLIIESLLGLKLEANRLYVEPLMPPEWGTFSVDYVFHETTYRIVVERSTGSSQPPGVVVDNVTQPDNSILLLDDRRQHDVRVVRP